MGGALFQGVGKWVCRSLKVGLWGRSTNATLRLHDRLERDAAEARGTGWEKGLLAKNQSPDRTPGSVQRFQPHRRWESTPRNPPTKGQT